MVPLLAGEHVVGRVCRDPADSLFYDGVVGDEEVYFDNQPFVAMQMVEDRARLMQAAGGTRAERTRTPMCHRSAGRASPSRTASWCAASPPGAARPTSTAAPAAAFETVAWAIDDRTEPFTLEDLQAATGLPFTQVAVALAFIKERGCVVLAHGRTHKAASGWVNLDEMTEYHARREGAPGAKPSP